MIIIITYLLTFIDKIGLHGDEAFLGLDAIEFTKNGISRAYGMTKYTGILQSLMNAVFFKLWKVDVVSIRMGGAICNSFSLLLISQILVKRVSYMATLVFLLLFAQSAFLLCYSKIAWEVCSFNFLLITTSLFSIHKLANIKPNSAGLFSFIFLGSTLLGAYNHIIFSSTVLTLAISIPMWLYFNKIKPSEFLLRCYTLISISLVNIILLFLFMNLCVDYIWERIGVATFSIPLILIFIEVVILKKISPFIERILRYLSYVTNSKKAVKLILVAIITLVFILIYSLKLIDVLANRIVFLRVFSYQLPAFFNWYFIISSALLIIFTLYNLISDLIKDKTTFWTYFITVYLFIFCFYTQGFALRYYHILTILLFLYISINLIIYKKTIQLILIAVLSINMILTQYTLWYINFDNNRKVKALIFKIGSKDNATSAHFLNFSPVIDYVKKNKIGIIHTDAKFFIGNVFEFHKYIYPEIEDFNNSAKINYEYKTNGSGFKIE